jgi:orotate phosphoribosyltransferase
MWRNPRLYDFVDHGLSHSFSDLIKATEILKFLSPDGYTGGPYSRLSNLEKSVLGIAALVHDVGMQYEKCPAHDAAPLTKEEIRKRHPELGFDMLSEAIEGKFSGRGGPNLPGDAGDAWILEIAGTIGFAHSGDTFWNQLAENHWDDVGSAGDLLRPRLLAGAVRLADEIDNAYPRVQEFNRWTASGVSDLTKAHWAACYYIQDVRIKVPGSGAVVIEVRWRVPRDSPKEEIALIRALLHDFRRIRMEQEAAKVESWLRPREDAPNAVVRITFGEEPMPARISRMPESVLAFIRENVVSIPALKPLPPPIIHQIDLNPYLLSAREALFRANSSQVMWTPDHVALRTGWHSSRYYQCRQLLTEASLMDQLTLGLAELYRPRGFTDILAVGSSGIRLGSVLALALGCRFQFTFSQRDIKSGLSSQAGYTPYETDIEFSSESRVLIVDDIIGVGSVVSEIYARLQALPETPSYVRVFCLLSLGREKVQLDETEQYEVDYLLDEPSVEYWKEDEDHYCEECRGRGWIVDRED